MLRPAVDTRFGEQALVFRDPHGLPLALVATEERSFVPWEAGPVPTAHQVRGLHAVRLWERERGPTTRFLEGGLGLVSAGHEGEWHRYTAGNRSGTWIDVREFVDLPRGAWGTGSVHHIAWRVPTPEAQLALRERVAAAGRHPTEVIDRFWFKSIYFKEPGGALFEIATDGPGFTVDEAAASLGERLILPPWLESQRVTIEGTLPALP
jgi:glyoxalase family protein